MSGNANNAETIYGGAGGDVITMGSGSANAGGGATATAYGGEGADSINAVAGQGHVLFGGGGADTIEATGADTIAGGSESDRFDFGAGGFSTRAVVTDFVAGSGGRRPRPHRSGGAVRCQQPGGGPSRRTSSFRRARTWPSTSTATERST